MPKWKHVSKASARRYHKRHHCADCKRFFSDEQELEEFFYPGEHWNYSDDPSNSAGLLCADCAGKYWCLSCRYFCAGTEDFDFSPHPGYCRDCWDEIRYENGEMDDEDCPEYDPFCHEFDDEAFEDFEEDFEDG